MPGRPAWSQPLPSGNLPTPRKSHSLTHGRGKIYLFGGSGASGEKLADTYALDTTTYSWQALADPKCTLVIYMGLSTLPDLERRASGSFSDAGDDEAPPPSRRARARTVSDCRRPSVLTRELADLSVTTRKRRRARSCDDDGCWGQFLELSGDEDARPRKLTISPALKIGSWPPRAV